MDVPVSSISPPPAASVIDQIDRYRKLWFALIGLFLLLSFNGQWQMGGDSAAYRAARLAPPPAEAA